MAAGTAARVRATEAPNFRQLARLAAGNAPNFTINRGFRDYSIWEFIDWFTSMSQGIQPSDAFGDCVPTKEAIARQSDDLQKARIAVQTRAKSNAAAEEHQLAAVAVVMADQLADWIEANPDRTLAMVETARMTINKTTKTRPLPPGVTNNLRLNMTNTPSTLIFTCDAQPSMGVVITYILEVSTDGRKTWQQAANGTDSRKLIVSNLVRGKEYSFRVYARNSGGEGLPSAIIDWIGQ